MRTIKVLAIAQMAMCCIFVILGTAIDGFDAFDGLFIPLGIWALISYSLAKELEQKGD